MIDAATKHEARLIQAAQRYADATESDPFTLARCKAHIKQGLCGSCEGTKDDPEAGIFRGLFWYWREGNKSHHVKLGGEMGDSGHYDAVRDQHGWRNVVRT